MIPNNPKLCKVIYFLQGRQIIINSPNDYKNESTPIACTCLKSGYGENGEWTPRIMGIRYKGSCCPPCGLKNRSISDIEFGNIFKEALKSYLGDDYKFTGTTIRKWRCGNYELQGEMEHICGLRTFRRLSKLKEGIGCKCNMLKHGKANKLFKGIGDIPATYWSALRRQADKRKVEFNITIEYGWNLYLGQDKRCALSGVNIVFGSSNARSKTKNYRETTASMDRIDSTKGYIEGNVQWLHKDINWMKNNHTDREFIEWCHKISKFNESTILHDYIQNN